MFQFKQFKIEQSKCAMKVGTDSVTLGAWAQIYNSKTLLDIGTGSGILSLMMAQRFPHLSISAIEIDKNAYIQACENVDESPWAKRISVLNQSLQETIGVFDYIICNPPYFNSGKASSSAARAMARHTDSLSFLDLIENSKRLLSSCGRISIIIPTLVTKEIEDLGWEFDLHVRRLCELKHFTHKFPKRTLLEFSLEKCVKEISSLIVKQDPTEYTSEYLDLTKDFYNI